jgi:hypothetical protein
VEIHILEVPFGCQEIQVYLYLILVITSDVPDKKAFLDPIIVISQSHYLKKKTRIIICIF